MGRVDNPVSALITRTLVFDGVLTAGWADLDLSPFTGSRSVLAFLSVLKDSANNAQIGFRKKGDAEGGGWNGTAMLNPAIPNEREYSLVRTSAAGVVECYSGAAEQCKIYLEAVIP